MKRNVVAAAFGILLGLMIGLSVSPVVAGAATAAFALLGAVLGIRGGEGDKTKALMSGPPLEAAAFFAIFCVLALLLGTHLRTNRWLEPSATARVQFLKDAGVSADDAKRVVLRYELTRLGLPPVLPLSEQRAELMGLGFSDKEARAVLERDFAQGSRLAKDPVVDPPKADSGVLFARARKSECDRIVQTTHNTLEEWLKDLRVANAKSSGFGDLALFIQDLPSPPSPDQVLLYVRGACALAGAPEDTMEK